MRHFFAYARAHRVKFAAVATALGALAAYVAPGLPTDRLVALVSALLSA